MKILFLQKRLLFPADSGGKIRTLNIVRHLAQWHEVTYLCNTQPGDCVHEETMRELGVRLETVPWKETPRESARFYGQLARNLLSRYPFNVAKDYDPRLRGRAAELLSQENYDLLICDFVQMARNAAGLAAPASLLFQHNVEAQIFERQAATDSSRLRRQFMGYQHRKMRRFEARAGRWFDAVVAVSRRDRKTFERQYGWRHVHTIDTGVDTQYFSPNGRSIHPQRVVFVGSLDWMPNQDGVAHFVNNIWPHVLRQHPQAHFQVVGRNPSESVKRLGGHNRVEVVGTVSDVRPFLQEAAVVVVPLRIGGGTRIKIFEAMAMRKAVVSTTLGAEGLPVEDEHHLLLADEPQEFARSVNTLISDTAKRDQLGAVARKTVEDNYSAEVVARQFESICQRTVEHRKAMADFVST